jgi:hypothetical protein
MAERLIELDVSGEHDLYVLSTALEYIREEFLARSEDPTEATGAPFLQWAAAAENLRLQVQEH